MATLKVRFIKGQSWRDYQTVETAYIVGRKMTKSWMNEHYGKDGGYKELYKCHANPYGIVWIMGDEDRYGNFFMDICTDPAKAEKKLPYYDKVVYSKV